MKFEDIDNNPLEKIWRTIEEECSDVVKKYRLIASHDQIVSTLVHEMKPGKTYTVIQTGPRKPKDIPAYVNAIADSWLKSHGFTALRGNALFTRFKPLEDAQYGPVNGGSFMVFPSNGYALTFAPKILDFYENLEDLINIAGDNVSDALPVGWSNHIRNGIAAMRFLESQSFNQTFVNALKDAIYEFMNAAQFSDDIVKLAVTAKNGDQSEAMIAGNIHLLVANDASVDFVNHKLLSRS